MPISLKIGIFQCFRKQNVGNHIYCNGTLGLGPSWHTLGYYGNPGYSMVVILCSKIKPAFMDISAQWIPQDLFTVPFLVFLYKYLAPHIVDILITVVVYTKEVLLLQYISLFLIMFAKKRHFQSSYDLLQHRNEIWTKVTRENLGSILGIPMIIFRTSPL